jgi:hypothetical protein
MSNRHAKRRTPAAYFLLEYLMQTLCGFMTLEIPLKFNVLRLGDWYGSPRGFVLPNSGLLPNVGQICRRIEVWSFIIEEKSA